MIISVYAAICNFIWYHDLAISFVIIIFLNVIMWTICFKYEKLHAISVNFIIYMIALQWSLFMCAFINVKSIEISRIATTTQNRKLSTIIFWQMNDWKMISCGFEHLKYLLCVFVQFSCILPIVLQFHFTNRLQSILQINAISLKEITTSHRVGNSVNHSNCEFIVRSQLKFYPTTSIASSLYLKTVYVSG